MDTPLTVAAIATLRTGACGKLANPEMTTLNYAIGADEDDHVHIALTGNAESGYFSTEWVAVTNLLNLLSGINAGNKPFSSKVLLQAFRGKSCNNASFMAAVLHREQLIRRADKPFAFLLNDEWEVWVKAQTELKRLSQEGLNSGAQDDPVHKTERGRKR